MVGPVDERLTQLGLGRGQHRRARARRTASGVSTPGGDSLFQAEQERGGGVAGVARRGPAALLGGQGLGRRSARGGRPPCRPPRRRRSWPAQSASEAVSHDRPPGPSPNVGRLEEVLAEPPDPVGQDQGAGRRAGRHQRPAGPDDVLGRPDDPRPEVARARRTPGNGGPSRPPCPCRGRSAPSRSARASIAGGSEGPLTHQESAEPRREPSRAWPDVRGGSSAGRSPTSSPSGRGRPSRRCRASRGTRRTGPPRPASPSGRGRPP